MLLCTMHVPLQSLRSMCPERTSALFRAPRASSAFFRVLHVQTMFTSGRTRNVFGTMSWTAQEKLWCGKLGLEPTPTEKTGCWVFVI